MTKMRHPKVEIDRNSGFCAGVIGAITKAEDSLREQAESGGNRKIYSLGAIVHNESELLRMEKMGLITIDKEDLDEIAAFSGDGGTKGNLLLIRAHGEPPEIYTKAENLGLTIVDCTCPVVLKLQKHIREAHQRQKENGEGQILIFGKPGHAEVLGLVGQTEGSAVVVENMADLEGKIADGGIRTDIDTEIFSQTTKSPAEYAAITDFLNGLLGNKLHIHDTICRQVATRHRKIESFARKHDVIVFVSGKASSNGRVLCDLCKSVNIRTYHISNPEEIKAEWFRNDDRIGVCGATSTPKWLLEKVSEQIVRILQLNK